ncbi:hypothetical protein J5Y03_09945 [Bacillus sp. RG28]|uniref:YesK-like protein n=1 Tax=Gottfriedia endophytica TaxID=2820819 RepID=A0A940SK15_9BACI|nr:YesK family protein [Gottfriedia endophytica]MBP0725509.1 hypothetical protein [Gottfriedia endophytica]
MLFIIVIIVIIALFIYLLNILASKKTFRIVSLSISAICFIVLLYSIFGIGGWEGMGVGICTLIAFAGIAVGMILTVLFPKKNDTISK